MLAIERCHLRVAAMVATPYAAGLSTLVDDEVEMGAALIDFGGGSTTVGVFVGGRLVHVDAVAVGGNHVTMDVARGLSVSFDGRRASENALRGLHRLAVRRSRLDCGSSRRRRRGSAEPSAEIRTRANHSAAHRGNSRIGARPARGGGTRRPCRTPTGAYRWRLPADRPAGTRSRHRFEPGAHRQTARRRRVAGVGQESGFRRSGRASWSIRKWRESNISSRVDRIVRPASTKTDTSLASGDG